MKASVASSVDNKKNSLNDCPQQRFVSVNDIPQSRFVSVNELENPQIIRISDSKEQSNE